MAQRTVTFEMRVFILIWFGQLVSLIGSSLTSFALGIWVYQRTGSVTQFALISLAATLPLIVISPVAGTLVDRWNRRWVMILDDSGGGLSTLAIALLLATGRLEVWHIYMTTSISSTFSAFQWPAYTAATTLLVPKQHLGRASGMTQMGRAVARLISPVLGGILLGTIQLQGVILFDFTTFIFALVTLLSVRFPEAKTTVAGKAEKGSLLRETAYGWTYITARPGLLGLLIFFAASNFLLGIVKVLVTPLVLSFASPVVLGTILSISGIGLLVGSLVMIAWGGSQRRINSVFSFMLLGGLCILAAGLRPSVPLFALAAFLFFFGLAIINSSVQVIFQQKVAPDVQGRVFAFNGAIAGAAMPLAYVVAGPLADQVFEPLMVSNGPLAGSIGQIVGVGPGRGIGLLFVVMGVLTILATVAAYQYPRLRLVEDELPDARNALESRKNITTRLDNLSNRVPLYKNDSMIANQLSHSEIQNIEAHSETEYRPDKPEEACGVFGIYAPEEEVAKLTYFGLYALQHRGQESAGIATFEGDKVHCHKDMGLVSQVFNQSILNELPGSTAVGHTRYSTTGSSLKVNAQPAVIPTRLGPLALAHNGNLVNTLELRQELEKRNCDFITTTDSEMIALAIAEKVNDGKDWLDAVFGAFQMCSGAYSLVIGTPAGLMGVRDPNGIRPLVIGTLDNHPTSYVLASETCGLDIIGAEYLRNVEPGELVWITEAGLASFHWAKKPERKLCIFEMIYFARPDSIMYDESLYSYRLRLGEQLAKEAYVEADLVMGVPDSGVPAAIGFSRQSGILYGEGLIKNRYVGRTFIQPTQHMRESGIRMKLNTLKDVLDGKRVVIVDDSIVRGTTGRKIVKALRDAGATEVHMRISSPPMTHPCFYGIDTDSQDHLIAATKSVEKIATQIGVDSLAYLSLEGMLTASGVNTNSFCSACFTGDYPIPEFS